jgi:lysophospholipase L1-like esterase
MKRLHRTAAVALLALALVASACSKHADRSPTTTKPDITSTTLVPRPAGYVALGDSYSAGGGAPPYDVNPGCAVSSKGYPYALDAADAQVTLLENRSCGGAKTENLVTPWAAKGLPAQIPTTPDPDVGLVTLTIGGNDTGFLPVIGACATLDCSGAMRAPETGDRLSSLTDALSGKVYPALRKAYPNARLVQIGYPYITSTKLGQTCSWLASDEETVPNQLVKAVNTAIHAAAQASGEVEFLDQSSVFKGHELCTPNPWVNDLSTGLNALHPTAAGYQAVGRAAARALQG